MTVRIYRSTDINAPACSGEIGKLINVLSACLVNGYALPTVTSINRTGTTATIVFASVHGLVSFGNRVTIAGATQTDYNGEYEMTVVNTTDLSYTVANSPATPATGTITATKPGSGWTLPFTGTNLAAYKQGTGSNNMYLRVDDTVADARVVGYEAMTDVNTGTGLFPTATQLAGGAYIRKSSLADATVRTWILIATEKAFYFWINQAANLNTAFFYFFGDIPSYKVGDVFNTALLVNSTATTGSGVSSVSASIGDSNPGNWMPRSYTQTGTSVVLGKSIDYVATAGASSMGASGVAYPNIITGGLTMSPVYVHEPSIGRRGIMPGIISPLHSRPLTHIDTFSGTGDYAGKKYLVLTHNASGQSFIEISNTW